MQIETILEKTKVCALDLENEIINYLKANFDVFEGTLGKRVKAEYGWQTNSCRFLLNFNLPKNIHEYEVFIEDMERDSISEYSIDEHTHNDIETEKTYYFYCNKPQNIFNPIAFGSAYFKDILESERVRPAIKIVFLSDKEQVSYCKVNMNDHYDVKNFDFNNYEHLPDFCPTCLTGRNVKLCANKLSTALFQTFLSDIQYKVSFRTPWTYDNDHKRIDDPNFIPLLQTATGSVVSFAWASDREIVIGLPQTTRKLDLLKVVFDEILYKHFSEYFPEVAKSTWINNQEYSLPNHSSFLKQKEEIEGKYKADIELLDRQIEENNKKYAFLHTLLTSSGDELVKATIKFLRWLGFANVIDKDMVLDKSFNEEDIQIDLGDDEINGCKLLVIEVKGVGGTSTDAQCSQISKVVRRRGKERKAYDVHGLYIVNNEMHRAPLARTLPPFDQTKITDAENDERGLCYTWQLFNLYFNVESGVISKKEARECLFASGLVDFHPRLSLLGTPHKYYQNNTVACVNIIDRDIRIGDSLYYCVDERWHKTTILSIKDGEKSFDSVKTGSYGFGLDQKVPSKEPLYIKD